MSKNQNLHLDEISVGDLIPHTRHLVTTSGANTVKDFLEIVNKNQFTSLPIFKFPENKFIGFVDCLDIAALLVEIATKSTTAHPGSVPSTSLKTDDLETLFQRGQQFNNHNLADLVGLSGRPHWPGSDQTIALTASLAECVKKMSQGVHRLIVTGSGADGQGFSIITQSDVVQWLSQDTERRLPKSKLEKTARQLGWCDPERALVQVPSDQPTIEALQFMHRRGVAALAIVNQDGALRDTLSASDLRRPEQNLQDFLKPIGQFASAVRKGRKPVSLSPNDTLEEFVLAFRQARVHRLFIVEGGRPIGVVALTDILRQMDF